MTSSNGNIFRVTGHSCGEFTGDRSPVNSPHKGQWRGALMFPLICVGINDWVNNGEAGDLRRYRVHYDVIAMKIVCISRRRVHRRHLESRWRISVTSWNGDELYAVDNPYHYTWDILDMARWGNILPFGMLDWLGEITICTDIVRAYDF